MLGGTCADTCCRTTAGPRRPGVRLSLLWFFLYAEALFVFKNYLLFMAVLGLSLLGARGTYSGCGAWVGLVLQVSLPASQHVGS